MIKIALIALAVMAGLMATQSTRTAEAGAGHCTFWACSLDGGGYPTPAVCKAKCAGGTCSPYDICN